jgi:hypothetical protein
MRFSVSESAFPKYLGSQKFFWELETLSSEDCTRGQDTLSCEFRGLNLMQVLGVQVYTFLSLGQQQQSRQEGQEVAMWTPVKTHLMSCC